MFLPHVVRATNENGFRIELTFNDSSAANGDFEACGGRGRSTGGCHHRYLQHQGTHLTEVQLPPKLVFEEVGRIGTVKS